MHETSSPKFSRWQKALLFLGILAGCGLLGAWLLTTAVFWEELGWRLVGAVQNRLTAEVAVKRISGNLITGMIFHEVTISRPEGEILRLQQLEVSLSLLSFLRLQPVLRTLIFRQPELFLRQDAAGVWNVTNLLKKRPPPPFSQIHLPRLQILDGSVRVDRAGQHQVCQDLQVQLNLTVQAPGRPQLAVVVHQGSLGLTLLPYPRLAADLALTYTGQAVQVEQSQFSLGGLPVLSLQGRMTQLAADPELALDLQVPLLSGSQLQELWPTWPASLPLQGRLEVKGPLSDLRVSGQGDLQECRWQVAGRGQRPTGADPDYQLTLTFQHLTEALLSAWRLPRERTAGLSPLHGSLTISGAGRSWPLDSMQAVVALQPFSFRQARFEAASLTANLNRVGLQQLALKLQGNFGRLEAQANGTLWPLNGSRAASAGELSLLLSSFNPALLLGGQAPPGALEAKFAGKFQVPPAFQWRQARLAGTLQAAGKFRDYAIQELAIQGRWEAGEAQLDQARLRLAQLRAEAQGRLSAARADLKLALELLPPGPWPGLPPDFRGQLRAEGSVQGPWQTLAYQVQAQGTSLSWRRLALASFRGKITGTAGRETFTIAGFDLLVQDFTTPVGRFGRLQGRGQTQGADLHFEMQAQQSPGESGALAGVVSWAKNAAQVRISRFSWGPADFRLAATEPVTLSLAPGRFELSPLHLRHQQTHFSLAGRLSSEALALQARLENLPFQTIARLVPQLSLIQGTINAAADLTGSGQAPVLQGQVKMTAGAIGKFAFDVFQSDWRYQGQVLSLSGQMVEKPDKARLVWQGTAPLTFSLRPWSWHLPESGLNLRVWSDNLNLSLFSQIIPGVAASEGPMQLQVTLTGGLRQPLLAGALRFGPGSLTIRESGAPLALEPGEIRLEGDRLVVSRLVFQSGDGRGEITGGARVPGFKLTDVNLQLTANQLLVIRREGSRAVASGKASLQGTWPNFQAEGRLTVADGQFRLAFFRAERNREIILLPRVCVIPAARDPSAGAAAVVRNFTVKLVLDIPGGVWLRDKDLNGELEGQIKVLRQPPGPRYLGGWLKARQGAFAINNKLFTVEKALLTFPGAPHKPILLEARAARQIEEYTLFVSASGPLDNPRTRLDSIPPLPPRDQLSLLVFDHLADKMTREEYITATQKATGILGSLTTQKLRALLGSELPLLGEVSPTTSQEAVGVGKKLTKDITVSYERKLNPLQGEDLNQIRLNYKFNQYFSAESQLGRKNTGGDLFFNVDF